MSECKWHKINKYTFKFIKSYFIWRKLILMITLELIDY